MSGSGAGPGSASTAGVGSSEGAGGRMRRRTFVKIGVVAGAGLALGVGWRVTRGPGVPPTDAAFAPNAYLRIGTDGTIRVVVDRSEMGQGVATALPLLVAE